MSELINNARKVAKRLLYAVKGVETDFNAATLPWVDAASAEEIDRFAANFAGKESLNYNLADKLHQWQRDGYVILEGGIPPEWIDQYWLQVRDFIDNHDKFSLRVLVEEPGYEKQTTQRAKDIPKSVLDGMRIKINDFHSLSKLGKQIMLHPNIVGFLRAIFDQTPVSMQSLTFQYGSQQPAHQDFPYVQSGIPSHLAASWIALEDVRAEAGPLFYYVGSHKIKKYNWGNGILYDPRESFQTPIDFSKHLEKVCTQQGLEKKVLLIKKGDVLFWHASLVHGGMPISNPALTRKSLVCHYSSENAFPNPRFNEIPGEKIPLNGAAYFTNKLIEPHEEDYYGGAK